MTQLPYFLIKEMHCTHPVPHNKPSPKLCEREPAFSQIDATRMMSTESETSPMHSTMAKALLFSWLA